MHLKIALEFKGDKIEKKKTIRTVYTENSPINVNHLQSRKK